MAFNKVPSAHIAGITVVAGNATLGGEVGNKALVIPIASIPELNPDGTEVTDGAGDIRNVAFALQEMLYQVIANIAVANRPANWKSYRSPGTEDDDGYATRSYTNQFEVSVGSVEVRAEVVP